MVVKIFEILNTPKIVDVRLWAPLDLKCSFKPYLSYASKVALKCSFLLYGIIVCIVEGKSTGNELDFSLYFTYAHRMIADHYLSSQLNHK